MLEKILVVDDQRMIRRSLGEALRNWGYLPFEAENKQAALELFETACPFVTLLDTNLPDGSGLDVLREIRRSQPDAIVVMITANASVDDTIAALRAGAYDFIVKPINFEEIRITLRNVIEPRHSRGEDDSFHRQQADEFSFSRIIGESQVMKQMKHLSEKVAESDVSSILLQGESGTGKDLLAKAIHYSSSRARKPFVAINCAAIPSTLMESELFGYEKGAFTDAKSRKEGLFETAAGGTLFLDEIGEIEMALQAKLLRVLEEALFRRVGGLRDLPLDVRVIAASNRNLKRECETGRFRLDLFYRLSIIQIDIPPLRARGDDVILLADYFIKTLDKNRNRKHPRRLSRQAAEAFRRYDWKGNVRELKNAVERTLILEDGDEITMKFMPKDLAASGAGNLNEAHGGEQDASRFIMFPASGISLDSVEEALIEQALKRSGGNITRAGELLRISRDRVRYHLRASRRKNSN